MTLTDKVIFYSFAIIVITFSYIDGFNSYLDKTDLTDRLDDFDMTYLCSWFPHPKKKKLIDAPMRCLLLLQTV